MGSSASKRVRESLINSPEFQSACDSVFAACLSLTQHAFHGVFPYQLLAAADQLHHLLTSVQIHPLVVKWVPNPPNRSQVDTALRHCWAEGKSESNRSQDEGVQLLGPELFKEWAAELFSDAVMSNAGKAVIFRVPAGVAGIVGIGALFRRRKEVVGTAIGVYSLSVVASIFLSLSR